MKILLTGATSFTGFWFAKALSESGHELAMPIRRQPSEYDGVRGERARQLESFGRVVACGEFGGDDFMSLVASESRWDVLAHHAAEVGDYRSANFDVAAALRANTHGFDRIIGLMSERGCGRVVVTGSVFEPGEGAGSDGLPAFSPYGLSKALTSQTLEYYAARRGLSCAKFVIPNPFGPFEEPRFTAYLMKTWRAGARAGVATPAYVRDNIHVELLAAAYSRFVGGFVEVDRLSPSGYVESQGRFAQRFAAEMRQRFGLACELDLAIQTEFPEPRIRIGTDSAESFVAGWDEALAWDRVAEYYESLQAPAKHA